MSARSSHVRAMLRTARQLEQTMRAPSAALLTITINLGVIRFGETRKHSADSTPKRKVAPPCRPQSRLYAQLSLSVVLPEASSEPPARRPRAWPQTWPQKKNTQNVSAQVVVTPKITECIRENHQKIVTTTRHPVFFSVAHPLAPRSGLAVTPAWC